MHAVPMKWWRSLKDYVLGGCGNTWLEDGDQSESLNAVETFCTSTNTWTLCRTEIYTRMATALYGKITQTIQQI